MQTHTSHPTSTNIIGCEYNVRFKEKHVLAEKQKNTQGHVALIISECLIWIERELDQTYYVAVFQKRDPASRGAANRVETSSSEKQPQKWKLQELSL